MSMKNLLLGLLYLRMALTPQPPLPILGEGELDLRLRFCFRNIQKS
jgi:hypothetical protein